MKRGDLIRELSKIAEAKGATLTFVRHGGNHDVYQIKGVPFIIGRHNDIAEQTARGTIRKARAL